MAVAPTGPAPLARVEHVAAPLKTQSQKFGTPALVLLLALAVVFTMTRSWNTWEGGRIAQVTNDAYLRRDLTPLSTKVAGLVRAVKVGDYQQGHKGDQLVLLEDEDYQTQVNHAAAAVDAAKAALENNRRQRELQDSRIQRALAGIDQANAQIAAARPAKMPFRLTSYERGPSVRGRKAWSRPRPRPSRKWKRLLPIKSGSSPRPPVAMRT